MTLLLKRTTTKLCGLCGRELAHDFHHFIPRTLHSNKWFKKRFTRQQMRAGVHVCNSCHSAIHDLVPDEKELGKNCNNLEKLLAHPKVAKYLKWKKKRGRRKDQ